jgi:AcrR family transcriptional regulator
MTKRDAICDAALELFAEQGIEATTIRDIAQRADAAEGTLYRHFNGKDDLAGWLYQRCAQELQSRLAEATEAAATPAEKLEALIRGVFDFFGDRPTSCTYLLSNRSEEADRLEKAGGDGRASTDWPPPLGFFVEVIEAGQAQGAFQDEAAPLLAGWILAMVQRTVLFLKAGTLDGTRASAIDRTVHGALRLVSID